MNSFRVNSCVSWANPTASPQRGSLILLVMCLLTVLGIALASYLAVSNNAMKLSHRSAQTALSAQLAEMGLEEALRAFNTNNWADWTANGTTADWTLSGTTATCTITFPTTKFGQGVASTVSIRIDNYNANQLNASYSSSTTYSANDLVGSSGIWYRAVANGFSAQSPTTPGKLRYWVPEPVGWQWSSGVSYPLYSAVCYNGQWYRCHTAHTSSSSILPTNTSYWASIPITSSISLSYDSSATYSRRAIVFSNGTWYYSIDSSNTGHPVSDSTWWAALPTPTTNTWSGSSSYSNGDYVYYAGTWYRYSSGWVPNSAPFLSWMYRSGVTYSFNDLVYYSTTGSGTWYRCKVDSTTNVPTTTSDWEDALSGSMHSWSSGLNYNLGDAVYYGSTNQWYRCILAHTSSGSITPSDSTYWSSSPLYSTQWDSGRQYSQYDTVSYNGVWYLSLQNSNIGRNPSTATSYWIGANTTNTSYVWNSTTSYSVGNYRCYGGVWYKCLSGGAKKSPNNSSYWTASWSNGWGITTGAPVIYSEGQAVLPDSTQTIKTQLRATIAPAPLFPNAAGAVSSLIITSGTGTVNSYDSITDPTASTTGSSAVLAAGSSLAINGTTAVSGYLAWPSPPSGISSSTTINGVLYTDDKSRVSRSPHIPQFDPQPSPNLNNAFSNWNFPYGIQLQANPGGTVNIGTPGATTPSRYYFNNTLSTTLDIASSTSYDIGTLNINGPVILYVNGTMRIRAGGIVAINSNGSAEIHVDGGIRTDSSATSNGFVNRTLDPKKLILISDKSTTATQQLAAYTNDFYGVVYVPYTTYSGGLTIGSSVKIYGAISAKNITFSNAATVHYDTSLRYVTIPGVDQPWAVSEWRELTDPNERAVLP